MDWLWICEDLSPILIIGSFRIKVDISNVMLPFKKNDFRWITPHPKIIDEGE